MASLRERGSSAPFSYALLTVMSLETPDRSGNPSRCCVTGQSAMAQVAAKALPPGWRGCCGGCVGPMWLRPPSPDRQTCLAAHDGTALGSCPGERICSCTRSAKALTFAGPESMQSGTRHERLPSGSETDHWAAPVSARRSLRIIGHGEVGQACNTRQPASRGARHRARPCVASSEIAAGCTVAHRLLQLALREAPLPGSTQRPCSRQRGSSRWCCCGC